MKSRALPEFWDCLEQLPPPAQKTARKNFKLWQKNLPLKSLAFKKIKSDLWSVRAGSGFRALATFDGIAFCGFGLAPTMNMSA